MARAMGPAVSRASMTILSTHARTHTYVTSDVSYQQKARRAAAAAAAMG